MLVCFVEESLDGLEFSVVLFGLFFIFFVFLFVLVLSGERITLIWFLVFLGKNMLMMLKSVP